MWCPLHMLINCWFSFCNFFFVSISAENLRWEEVKFCLPYTPSIYPSIILSFFIQCSIHPHIDLSTPSMYPSILYFEGGTGDPVFSLIELTLKWRKLLRGDAWPCAMLRDVTGSHGNLPNLNLRTQGTVRFRLRPEGLVTVVQDTNREQYCRPRVRNH